MKRLNKNFYKSCRSNPTWQLKHINEYLKYNRAETLLPGIKGHVVYVSVIGTSYDLDIPDWFPEKPYSFKP
jgi:hypothetical protein